ncbi:MAG: hypothetical protein JW839_16595 [Candidatus Lokiarchaeota archaeon]|nr:hypothetical protein [Candidatus Lokiarchaeota archaeon]
MERTEGKGKGMGIKEWVDKSVRVNPINNFINMFFLGGIYYVIIGTAATHGTVVTNVGFLLLYITYSTINVPADAVRNARTGFVKGKWILKAGEVPTSAPTLPIAFRGHLVDGLVLGLAATGGGIGLLLLVGGGVLLPFVSVGYAYAIVTVLTGWIMRRHLADDLARVAGYKAGDAPPRPFKVYYIKEFAVPWTAVLIVVNLAFTIKGNVEGAIKYASILGGGVLLPMDFEFMVLTTSFFVLLWTGELSMLQVPTDVKLGRIRYPAPRSAREAMKMLAAIVGALFGISLACWLVARLAIAALGLVAVPVVAFVAWNLAIVIPCGLVGLRLGMPFGMALGVLGGARKRSP